MRQCRPGKKTDMALPFNACTPSMRAEFRHDDVKMVLTELCYAQKGLDLAQVREGMDTLLKAAPAKQEALHRCAWLQ